VSARNAARQTHFEDGCPLNAARQTRRGVFTVTFDDGCPRETRHVRQGAVTFEVAKLSKTGVRAQRGTSLEDGCPRATRHVKLDTETFEDGCPAKCGTSDKAQ
jgi:hypothetical protein